jgi:hypothetical protein
MEIEISDFLMFADAGRFSGSVAELGVNAGRITWANSMSSAASKPLLTTPEEIAEARDWARGFGAWDDETIDRWSETEVNALVLQFVAGEIREIEQLCTRDDGRIDWDKASELSDAGTLRGDVYPGDDGKFYFCMESS